MGLILACESGKFGTMSSLSRRKIAALSASIWKISSFFTMPKTLKGAGITHTSLRIEMSCSL